MMIAFECDFCGKTGLQLSEAGIMYCPFCNMSYGEIIKK
jgi:ribosomal protein L37AE/L43A